LCIEGAEDSVKATKSIIQTELDNYSKSFQEDDDIIFIDPYELFDTTNQIRPNRKMENFENSLDQLNIKNTTDDSPIDHLISRNYMCLFFYSNKNFNMT